MALETGEPKLQTVDPNQYSIRAEKDLEKSNVNWAKVASDLTGVVDKVRDDRQTRKKELDDATTEAMNNLNEIVPVDNQTLGTMVLDTSNASKEALQIQNDLMKQGKLKPNDYMKFQQRLSDQWASWNNSVKNWDASYKTAMERVQNGTASAQEIFINELTQSFGNVNGLQMYVNPETGDMSLVRMNEDGSMPDPKKNPDAYMSMNYINQRMNQQVDKVIVRDAVAGEVDKFANIVTLEINDANGAYRSYEDFRNIKDAEGKPAFKQMLSESAEQYIVDPNSAASVLADNLRDYSYTLNPDEAKDDPKKILLQNNSNGQLIPQLTDEQKEVAKEFVMNTMEKQLDSKMGYDKGARFDPTRKSAQDYGRNRDKIAGYMGNANRLQTSNDEEFELVSRDIITDVNAQAKEGDNRIENIDRNADEFIVTIVDSRGRTRQERIPRKKDGENLSMQDVAQGLIRYIAPSSQIGDQSFDAMVDIYNEVSGGFTGDVSSEAASAGVGFQEIPTISYRPEETEVFTELGDTNDIDAVSIAAGDLLNSKLRRLGMQGSINIDPDRFGGDGEITIKIDGVGEETIRYDGENANVLQLVKDYVEKARIVHNAEGGVKKSGGTTTSSGGNVR